MSLQRLTQPFPWAKYSKKLSSKIEKGRCSGFFTEEATKERQMHLAVGKAGSIADGNEVWVYWLVDPDDGIVVDAKYQAYGQSALIGAAEVVCELVVGKNYDQAKRISADLIDKQVRDRGESSAFPKETYQHLNLLLSALDQAAEGCVSIPLPQQYVATPAPLDIGEVLEGGYPGWMEMSQPQKMGLLETVLDQDVRPYIELDAGGVKVLDLINGREVIIAYEGSCTSCFAATGTTLSYIQKILRSKVHPDLVVIPDLSGH